MDSFRRFLFSLIQRLLSSCRTTLGRSLQLLLALFRGLGRWSGRSKRHIEQDRPGRKERQRRPVHEEQPLDGYQLRSIDSESSVILPSLVPPLQSMPPSMSLSPSAAVSLNEIHESNTHLAPRPPPYSVSGAQASRSSPNVRLSNATGYLTAASGSQWSVSTGQPGSRDMSPFPSRSSSPFRRSRNFAHPVHEILPPRSIHSPVPVMSAFNRAAPAGAMAIPTSHRSRSRVSLAQLANSTPSRLQNNRYDRGERVQQNTLESTIIKPLTTVFKHHEDLPPGWTHHAHPEGQLYFHNESRRIVTDAYMYDQEIANLVINFSDHLFTVVADRNLQLPEGAELAIDLSTDNEHELSYYFADVETRCVFWLDEFDTSDLNRGVPITSHSHFRHILEHMFWSHWEMFPLARPLDPDHVDELLGTLVHGSIDLITSPNSTAPWSSDETQQLISLVEKMSGSGPSNAHRNVVLGRLMSFLAYERFRNCHGQRCARLCRDQSVWGEHKKPRTSLMTILSPLLFHAPDTHLTGLEEIWVDQIVRIGPWKMFMGKLVDEWQEFILFGTVLLNANVAFLAIPSVDNNNVLPQIASYVSVIASIGGIILGLLLTRQHRRKDETADIAADYLDSRTHKRFGLETLAIMYSLPYAMLMWAVVTFLIALCLNCFINAGNLQIGLVGASWVAILALIAWCIWTGWERVEHSRLAWFVDAWRAFKAWLSPKPSFATSVDGDPEKHHQRSLFQTVFCLTGNSSDTPSQDPENGS